MRNLASVQVIKSLADVPNSDNLQLASVLGWKVVVSKGDGYREGDPVVYCEIDSLLPERPEFEFLRKNSYKPARHDLPAGFRIRTQKLRGQVSQGICFPLSVLPPGTPAAPGTDVTEALGILKWEPPAAVGMGSRAKGSLPAFIQKTDETRVQVIEDVLQRHRGKTFYVTEKLDGTSFTAFIRGGAFGLCSRNLLLDETDEGGVIPHAAKFLRVREKLEDLRVGLGRDVAVQGELVGPGIQKNKYGLTAPELYVFNLVDLDTGKLLPVSDLTTSVPAFGFKVVPVVGDVVLNHTVDELVELAKGASVLNPATKREGIVLRTPVEEYDPTLDGRLSFKVINPDFLLKYDE